MIWLINRLILQAVPNFKIYLVSDFYKKRNLNEDDFTQIFVEQTQILIRANDYPFNVNGQYRDITNLSKGYSDFYFYPNEQNVTTAAFFLVECKRLPSPEKSREREYVIGDRNNGGIERYKTEKHGKGLDEGGLCGFLEKNDFNYWRERINIWIEDLTKTNKDWKEDEILWEEEFSEDFCVLKSIAHRKSNDIKLTHFWILIN